MDATVFRSLMFSLAGISFGAAIYVMVAHLRRMAKFRDKPALHIGCAFIVVAWMMAIAAVLAVFEGLPIEEATWRGYLYLVALSLATAGFIMVGRATLKEER